MEVAKSEFKVGTVWGSRTVISDEIKNGLEVGKTKKSEWYVHTRCECEKEEWVRIHSLRQRRASLCTRCRSLRDRSPTFIGYKDMPGSVMSRIKNSANARKHTKNTIDFDAQYIYELFHLQDKKCALSGIELDWNTASLDRINSSLGYTKKNIQWVHKTVNNMKQNLVEEHFIEWCNLIIKNKFGI